MAADGLSITEQWIREKLNLQHSCLDVRSLSLPGSYETGKICHLGISLKNFVRLKSLDLSHNALESVQGIVHLKLLEKLNLYYNRLSSLEDVLALRRLQNLEELDLRLNPVVQKHPYYRLYLVHAISKLRKLDDFPVRDRERKAALMHFSVESAVKPSQKSQPFTEEKGNRSSDHRIASVNKMMMAKLSLREGNEETVLNYKFSEDRNTAVQEGSPLTEEKTRRESSHSPDNPSDTIHLINGYDSDASSAQDQESEPSLGKAHGKNETRVQHTVQRRSSLKSNDAPRVTFFNASVTRHSPEHLRQKPAKSLVHSRIQAKSSFTPHPSYKSPVLKDKKAEVVKHYSESGRNPVLHPPRLTYRKTEMEGDPQRPSLKPERADKLHKGAYKKPMELLLSLVDEYWAGKKKNHNTKHFFMQAVRILCMMEQEVVSGEEEMKALREKIQTLNTQAELQKRRHQSEIQSLSEQLRRAYGSVEQLDEQLRSVLEENVSLQKQLIRLEQKLLSDQLREMSNTGD
ncbi:centrosomal protein of 72 kDa [Colossoma macropomum]|uniref:centrosomal protein of 72 kDa n=1 Tax=Colossoma macropomum TaxID=42526 RepID=UPI001863D71B|nr:centrosomal protein of 72 kDa [Colossoma macropomum]